MTPEEAARAADELGAKAFLPVHVGKFSIASNSRDEPFERILKVSTGRQYRLLTPKIGEPVNLAGSHQTFTAWWRQTSAER